VLLDDDEHPLVARDRPQFLKVLHPQLAVVPLGAAHGEHLGDAGGGGLADPLPHRRHVLRRRAEQHERLEPQVAALLAEVLRRLCRRVSRQHRHALAVGLDVRRPPRHVAIARTLQPLQRSLEGELRVGERHAGDLEPGELAAVRRRLLGTDARRQRQTTHARL
jgi:hypothetical protein